VNFEDLNIFEMLKKSSSLSFGKGMDLRKWTSTVTDLIDVRKKVRIF
jgi:hypothetical protein